MFQPYRPSIRLSPRRHDVGAALMLKFRPKDGSTIRNRRLRSVDVMHAMLLPMICFSLAFAIKEYRGSSWLKPAVLAAQPVISPDAASSKLMNRIAPERPLVTDRTVASVRLTHIEDMAEESLMARPASLSHQIRVAEEESPLDSQPASQPAQPSLRAALHLGDQPVRAVQR
jgi:hypothetical protein